MLLAKARAATARTLHTARVSRACCAMLLSQRRCWRAARIGAQGVHAAAALELLMKSWETLAETHACVTPGDSRGTWIGVASAHSMCADCAARRMCRYMRSGASTPRRPCACTTTSSRARRTVPAPHCAVCISVARCAGHRHCDCMLPSAACSHSAPWGAFQCLLAGCGPRLWAPPSMSLCRQGLQGVSAKHAASRPQTSGRTWRAVCCSGATGGKGTPSACSCRRACRGLLQLVCFNRPDWSGQQ